MKEKNELYFLIFMVCLFFAFFIYIGITVVMRNERLSQACKERGGDYLVRGMPSYKCVKEIP